MTTGDIITKEQIAAVAAYAKTVPVFVDGNQMLGAKDYRGVAGDKRRTWKGFDWHLIDGTTEWSRCSPDYVEILDNIHSTEPTKARKPA